MANTLEVFPNRYGLTPRAVRHYRKGGILKKIKEEHFDGYCGNIRMQQFLEAADTNLDSDNNRDFGFNDFDDNMSEDSMADSATAEWFTCCNSKEKEVCPICSFSKVVDHNEASEIKKHFI